MREPFGRGIDKAREAIQQLLSASRGRSYSCFCERETQPELGGTTHHTVYGCVTSRSRRPEVQVVTNLDACRSCLVLTWSEELFPQMCYLPFAQNKSGVLTPLSVWVTHHNG
jgi:hypothetical protein